MKRRRGVLAPAGPTSSLASESRTILQEIWGRARNPLNALLLTLAVVSYFLGDVRAAIVIALMVLLAIGTAFHSGAPIQRGRGAPASHGEDHRQRAAARGRRRWRLRRGSARDAGPRRCRAAVGRRHDPGGPAAARDQGPVHQSVRADRRGHAGGEVRPRLRTAVRTTRSICPTSASWAPTSSAATAPASSCAPAARTFFGQLADEIAGRRVPTASTRASTVSPG